MISGTCAHAADPLPPERNGTLTQPAANPRSLRGQPVNAFIADVGQDGMQKMKWQGKHLLVQVQLYMLGTCQVDTNAIPNLSWSDATWAISTPRIVNRSTHTTTCQLCYGFKFLRGTCAVPSHIYSVWRVLGYSMRSLGPAAAGAGPHQTRDLSIVPKAHFRAQFGVVAFGCSRRPVKLNDSTVHACGPCCTSSGSAAALGGSSKAYFVRSKTLKGSQIQSRCSSSRRRKFVPPSASVEESSEVG